MEKKFNSNELPLAELLGRAERGELQLPDFQRGWVWDDEHIRSLLVSISLSYPIGAVMTLAAGNPDVNFKARLLEGVTLAATPAPDMLLLDGQQRLTSLFQALKSRDPVRTQDSRGKELLRHYYAHIEACIDPSVDREERGIVGVPADRIVRSDFGRTIDLDLSARDREIAEEMVPLDIVPRQRRHDGLADGVSAIGTGRATGTSRQMEAISGRDHQVVPAVPSADDRSR